MFWPHFLAMSPEPLPKPCEASVSITLRPFNPPVPFRISADPVTDWYIDNFVKPQKATFQVSARILPSYSSNPEGVGRSNAPPLTMLIS